MNVFIFLVTLYGILARLAKSAKPATLNWTLYCRAEFEVMIDEKLPMMKE